MRKVFFILAVSIFLNGVFPLTNLQAQGQDGRALYSRYRSELTRLNSSIAGSEKYNSAHKGILDMYPELMQAAIENQKRGNMALAVAYAKACVDVADMNQFAESKLYDVPQFPQFVNFVASFYYNGKEYRGAAKYLFRYLRLGVTSPKTRDVVYAELMECFLNMNEPDLAEKTQKMALKEYPDDQRFTSVDIAKVPRRQPLQPSDVDLEIPQTDVVSKRTFVFIIGNENYQTLEHVAFARHDAEVMAEYCQKTLGIPANQIYTFLDASYNNMGTCVRKMQDIAEAYKGNVDFIFYYSGHGMPDEESREAFLMPVDADGLTTDGCYSTERLYDEFNKLGAERVIVFLDACFSGARRDGGMLVSSRGVGLAPREEEPAGNMVILSASTGKQTAYPYREKSHGLFTYYLLKHLRETEGKTTLGELSDYIETNVSQSSITVNNKAQQPTTTPSPSVTDQWRGWKPE